MQGSGGTKGGDLFVKQMEPILRIRPKVVRLEMVPSVETVNDGAELELVLGALREHYHVHHKVLEVWRYGDPTTRRRLFIIGLRKDHFPTNEWELPTHTYADQCYPVPRDLAAHDYQVHPYI